jgi:hypothetical protein
MANLYIAAFKDAKEVALGLPELEESVTYAGTSVQSTVLPTQNPGIDYRVRIFSDADCYVTWGENPTALQDGTSGRPIGASNPEYFSIKNGHRLAVIERV